MIFKILNSGSQSINKRQKILLFFVFSLIFVIDRVSKVYVYGNSTIVKFEDIAITSFFNLTLVINDGVSFGMLSGLGARYFILAVTILISLVLIFLVVTAKNFYEKLAYCTILSGAAGNITDRATIGGVVDFIDFHIGAYHWPAFNVADSAIFVGVCLLICIEIRGFIKKNRSNKA